MTVMAAAPTHSRTRPAELSGRFTLRLASALSFGAAAIHLAAGPAHVESLGDLGLGFYFAALLQGAFALALLRGSVSRRLAWIGIALNVALIGAWAWSRLVGLPEVPGGPEAIGVSDGTANLLQVGLVGILAAGLRDVDTRRIARRWAPPRRPLANAGFAMLIGAVLVSTSFAVADAASGHGHDEGTHGTVSTDPTHDEGNHGPISTDPTDGSSGHPSSEPAHGEGTHGHASSEPAHGEGTHGPVSTDPTRGAPGPVSTDPTPGSPTPQAPESTHGAPGHHGPSSDD